MIDELFKQLDRIMVEQRNKLKERSDFEPDTDWPSPCEYQEGDKWYWQPAKQSDAGENNNFSNVESALDLTINAQYSAYFTRYFSDNVVANHEHGELELLFAWSQEDFTRLQQNLIGHLMMKQKLKQTPTLFFALTDEEDLNIVVDNDSGKVCLEYVGKPPHKELAENLADFLSACKVV